MAAAKASRGSRGEPWRYWRVGIFLSVPDPALESAAGPRKNSLRKKCASGVANGRIWWNAGLTAGRRGPPPYPRCLAKL